MTLKRLREIEQLVARATPGPWSNAFPFSGVVIEEKNQEEQTYLSILEPGLHQQRWEDLECAAISREVIPELCRVLYSAITYLDALSTAEGIYRTAHDTKGDGSPEAGFAWDQMRNVGNEVRYFLLELRKDG